MNESYARNNYDTLDLFQRTYRSLLRSSGEIQIEAMVEPVPRRRASAARARARPAARRRRIDL